MEPRTCLVKYDPATGEYRFNVCTQDITTLRKMMSSWTRVPKDKLIFEARDGGDGFGQRAPAYPETIALMIAAKALGITLKQVKVVQCAPGNTLEGNHTGGSRTTVGVGSVSHLAALKLIDEGKALAALELQLEPSKVQYAKGEFKSSQSKRTI